MLQVKKFVLAPGYVKEVNFTYLNIQFREVIVQVSDSLF